MEEDEIPVYFGYEFDDSHIEEAASLCALSMRYFGMKLFLTQHQKDGTFLIMIPKACTDDDLFQKLDQIRLCAKCGDQMIPEKKPWEVM